MRKHKAAMGTGPVFCFSRLVPSKTRCLDSLPPSPVLHLITTATAAASPQSEARHGQQPSDRVATSIRSGHAVPHDPRLHTQNRNQSSPCAPQTLLDLAPHLSTSFCSPPCLLHTGPRSPGGLWSLSGALPPQAGSCSCCSLSLGCFSLR